VTALSTSVVILAGGRSRRLGRDKATLLLGGLPLWQHVLRRVAPLTDDVVLVLRAGQRLEAPGCTVVYDAPAQGGVLAALANGLEAARHPCAWALPCDTPFVSCDLLRYERGLLGAGVDAVVPRVPEGLEPLQALYRCRCATALRASLAAGNRAVSVALAGLSVRHVDAEEQRRCGALPQALLNINTPQDLALAESLLRTPDGGCAPWAE
jgi:molybdopterin-guanine dinucleotide biosynthesis protein A